jgi:chromosome segregation ATPase
MNRSFLDRSMDTVNFTSNTFMEPQMKTTMKPVKIKENNHLDRIFDQTTVNQHFSGVNREMKMDFRPKSSFEMDDVVEQAHPVRQRSQSQQQKPQMQVEQATCQYCESYQKKNENYESMISEYDKKLSECMSKMKVNDTEKVANHAMAKDNRAKYDNISYKLKQKEDECNQLEKKIASIQLERSKKGKSKGRLKVEQVNKKYSEMVQHYERVIGDLKSGTPPQNPMLTKLIPILCNKLNKTEEQIKEKLINYPIPEKLNSEDLKNIIDLYK